MEIQRSIFAILFTIQIFFFAGIFGGRKSHVINFRSQNLFPESLTWDSSSQHFIVGSLRHPKLVSVSDAGVSETLISDPSLPPNSLILGVAADRIHRRILAVVHRPPPHRFNALAAYDAFSRRRVFLTPLPDGGGEGDGVANDVATDLSGNAYVTDSGRDLIWRVNADGEASVLSKSIAFRSHPVDHTVEYHKCGLNGVVFHSKGFLLVVQSNTGKLFKVDADNGGAETVVLNKDLTAADGIAAKSDGSVMVVSHQKLYHVKSDDNWKEGVVFDETSLEEERFASSVTVGNEDKVYVLYGHIREGMMVNSERDEFGILEIEKESEEESVWIYVLVAFGFAYFLFWRFQMRHLVESLNKKTV